MLAEPGGGGGQGNTKAAEPEPRHKQIVGKRARPNDHENTPPGGSPPCRCGKQRNRFRREHPPPVVPEGIDGAGDKEAEEWTQHWDLVFVTSGTALTAKRSRGIRTVLGPPPPRPARYAAAAPRGHLA